MNQHTFLYNIFCQALDANKEIRVVFCDLSKAFDCVWHAGLLCKLEAAGVSVKLLNWFKNSEYDQEIPQSQTADNPMAPRGRPTQPLQDTRKTN